MKHKSSKAGIALVVVMATVLALAATAQAKLTGNYTKFAQCPYPNLEVKKCVFSVTDIRRSCARLQESADRKPGHPAGRLGRGRRKRRHCSPILRRNQRHHALQNPPAGSGRSRRASQLQRNQQLLPGLACESTFENGVTGLNSTLELARPATEIGSAKTTSPPKREGAETAGQVPPGKPLPGLQLLRRLFERRRSSGT